MKREVTMYTIAEELDVSVAAVSRAFNPDSKIKKEKRELILQTAMRLGYVPNVSASRLSQRTIHIGVVLYGYVRVYDNEIMKGIENGYKELHNFKVQCDVRVLNANCHSQEQALAVLDEFGEREYDGVLVINIPRKVLAPKIEQLDAKGCKVVIFDSDIPDSKRLFVAMNNHSVATGMVVDLLKSAPVAKRHVAVFTAHGQDKLVSYFRQQAQDAGIHIVTECELSLLESQEAKAQNLELVRSVFEADPQIDGVYITSANCLPVCRYLTESARKDQITVIASDIFDEMRPYFQNGAINASIYQDPVSQGYEAMKLLYQHLAEKKEVPQQLLVHPQIIVRSNMMLF